MQAYGKCLVHRSRGVEVFGSASSAKMCFLIGLSDSEQDVGVVGVLN